MPNQSGWLLFVRSETEEPLAQVARGACTPAVLARDKRDPDDLGDPGSPRSQAAEEPLRGGVPVEALREVPLWAFKQSFAFLSPPVSPRWNFADTPKP